MQLKFLTILLMLCFGTSLFATTFRVNNTPNTDADFDNLIDAHAIARNGDTLLIEGSGGSYGSLTMTKRLTLIGPGYFLDENPNTSVSVTAKLDFLILDPGTDNEPSTGAAASEIIGLDFSNSASGRSIDIRVDDVIVRKCYLRSVYILNGAVRVKPATGVQIIQNYFTGAVYNSSASSDPVVNVQILNNIFGASISFRPGSSGAILHNIMQRGLSVIGFAGEIRSNIISSTRENDVEIPSLPNNQISHNIAAAGQFGDANGNFTTVVDNLFVGEAGNSTDGQWQLRPNSLAANRAHDGTDIGPFGGDNPYVLSGQGGSPAIIFFEAEPIGTASNRLKVRIRAKSSN